MGSSGDKTNSSVPTRNMVSQLATNVAAGAIGVMYIRQPCLIGVAVAKRSAAAVSRSALRRRCHLGTSQETYRVEGTGLPTPAMPNRVATAAAPRYRPLRFAERPPLGGRVAPRQGAGVRMSSLDATAGPRKPPGASNY